MLYVGAHHQWFTLPSFEIQAWFGRDIVTGKIKTPSYDEMEADSKVWMEKENNLESEFAGIKFQGDIGCEGVFFGKKIFVRKKFFVRKFFSKNIFSPQKTTPPLMLDDIMSHTNYFNQTFQTSLHVKNFQDFVTNKCTKTIMGFRDLSHIDPTTGKPSPALNGTWMDIKDDSIENYLRLH